jgi:hypothetical protein
MPAPSRPSRMRLARARWGRQGSCCWLPASWPGWRRGRSRTRGCTVCGARAALRASFFDRRRVSWLTGVPRTCSRNFPILVGGVRGAEKAP